MADKIINPLPIRLKQARIAKGISQKQLGIQLGLEVGSASARMNQYERGKHVPDFLMASKSQLAASANGIGLNVL